MPRSINETLAEAKAALAGSSNVDWSFAKAYTIGLGLTNFDLEPGAKFLFPWGKKITPLRNELPRVKGNGDTAHRWRQITGINTTLMPPGVSEGNRGGVVTTVASTVTSTYTGLGEEDYVTEEARYAAQGFDDLLGDASENLLKAVMISEERMILGGNPSVALGTPTTPTVAMGASTGGALSNGTFYAVVVALTPDGYQRGLLQSPNAIVQQIVRSNADGTTDTINGGTSIPSAAGSGTISGGTSTQTLAVSTPYVQGAVAYAWYLGTAATHQYFAAFTTTNSLTWTAAIPTTGQDAQTLTATDYSATTTTYSFAGLLYSGPFVSSTSNSYWKALGSSTGGAQMTTDNSGGITEIDTLLRDRYDNYRLSPDTIWCNSQEMISIKTLVIKNGGAPLVRFSGDWDKPAADLIAGTAVGFYLNPVTSDLIRVRVHPFQTPGTLLFTTKEAPYAGARVSTLLEMRYRQEYYSTLWPMRTRKREYGVYVDETLVNYFPPAMAALSNILPTTS